MPYYKFAMDFSGIVLRNRKKLFLLERLRDGESSGLRIPLTLFSKGDTCRGAAYWVLPEAALRLQRDEVVSPLQGFVCFVPMVLGKDAATMACLCEMCRWVAMLPCF